MFILRLLKEVLKMLFEELQKSESLKVDLDELESQIERYINEVSPEEFEKDLKSIGYTPMKTNDFASLNEERFSGDFSLPIPKSHYIVDVKNEFFFNRKENLGELVAA